MLDYSVTLHNVAEWHDVKRLERATDNSSNSQGTFIERDKFVSGGSSGVSTVLHTGVLSLNPTLNQNTSIMWNICDSM